MDFFIGNGVHWFIMASDALLWRSLMRAYGEARIKLVELCRDRSLIELAGPQGTRTGDRQTRIDTSLGDIYQKAVEKYSVLVMSEESRLDESRLDFTGYDYLVLLDPLDGTLNLFGGLPAGVNFAFGRIPTTKHFLIRDFEAAFVANYLSGEQYVWRRKAGYSHSRAEYTFGALEFKGGLEQYETYEVPDETAYLPLGERGGRERQEALLRTFRDLFPSMQRRAVDTTGLRMLRVLSGGLRAYGDLRGATRPWDTIPSICIILNSGRSDVHVLDGQLNDYQLETRLVAIGHHKRIGVMTWGIGSRVVVLRDEDVERFRLRLEQVEEDTGTGGPAGQPARPEDIAARQGMSAADLVHDIAPLLKQLAKDVESLRVESPEAARVLESLGARISRVMELRASPPLTVSGGDVVAVRELVTGLKKEPFLLQAAGRGTKVEIETEIPAGVAVHGTAFWLMRAMGKVIQNALDAMEDSAEKELSIRLSATRETCDIRFCDSGPGVPEAIARQLFHGPVVHGDGRLGMGAILAAVIARTYGGDISLEPRGREGNCVRLRLSVSGQ